jgi:hypothetical protein
MSTATGVLDADRLVEDGVPEAKVSAFARLLADVQHPGFDRVIAHQDLVRAGYSPERADELIEGALLGSGRSKSQLP